MMLAKTISRIPSGTVCSPSVQNLNLQESVYEMLKNINLTLLRIQYIYSQHKYLNI